MKYFIYTRKSSEESNRQAQSLETQKRILLEYAENNSLEIISIIAENKSAKDEDNREKFSKMLDEIENGNAEGILVAHLDRLSRNRKETGELIKLFEKGLLKEIRTPYRVYNTIHDLFSMDYEFLSAVHYSARLSIRVKEGNQTKIQKGEYPGPAKIGYLNRDRLIVVDPKRAHYIKSIFQAYLDGVSQDTIADLMFELGLRTNNGKKVHRSAISRILRDPFYIGKFKYNGKIYNAKHKRLISDEVFNHVQDSLQRNIYINKPRKDTISTDFLYKRKIKCNVCGCFHTYTLKKGKYKYYFCTNGKGICNQHKKYLEESQINDMLEDKICDFFIDKSLINKSLEIYKDKLASEYQDTEKTLKNLKNQLELVRKRQSVLLDLFIDGKIEETAYNEKLIEIKNEEKIVKNQINNLESNKLDELFETMEQVKNRLVTIDLLFKCDDFQTKDNLIKALLWNFSVEDGKISSIQYKMPFKAFEKVGKSAKMSDWLGDRESNPN